METSNRSNFLCRYSQIISRILFIFIAINLAFVFFHWIGDSVTDSKFAKARVKQAFNTGALIEVDQLNSNIDHGSPFNFIGIDQFAECFNALTLVSSTEGKRFEAAVVPTYQSRVGKKMSCRTLNQIVRDQIAPSMIEDHTKARLWHGAKPLTAILLPKFEFYQISILIRQMSYLGLALLLAYAFYRRPESGLTLIPFAAVAAMGSGLDVYGGIPNALPYTFAVLLPIVVSAIQSRYSESRAIYSAVLAGSLMAFVYILDGSLILALSLLIFLLYYATDPGRKERWRITILLTSVFVLSFFFSFVFKQIISIPFIGFDQVWNEFSGLIQERMGTATGGRERSPWFTFIDQVRVYEVATSWNMFMRNIIVYAGNISWIMGVTLALYLSLKYRTWAAISDLLAFGLIAFVVFFRYAAMTPHSYQHWFIVSRYVFVFFAFGMCMLLWMSLFFRRLHRAGAESTIRLNAPVM